MAGTLNCTTAYRLARKLTAYIARDNPQLLTVAHELVKGLDPIQFGKGSRSIYLWGRQYFLSGDQAMVMRKLVEAYKAKRPDVDSCYLETLVNPGSNSYKLAHIFRDHPLWGTLIQPGETRGSVRLVAPST